MVLHIFKKKTWFVDRAVAATNHHLFFRNLLYNLEVLSICYSEHTMKSGWVSLGILYLRDNFMSEQTYIGK